MRDEDGTLVRPSGTGTVNEGFTELANANESKAERRMRIRAQIFNEMTPEQRAQYDRICAIREKIGPVNFNVVELVRELRGNE